MDGAQPLRRAAHQLAQFGLPVDHQVVVWRDLSAIGCEQDRLIEHLGMNPPDGGLVEQLGQPQFVGILGHRLGFLGRQGGQRFHLVDRQLTGFKPPLHVFEYGVQVVEGRRLSDALAQLVDRVDGMLVSIVLPEMCQQLSLVLNQQATQLRGQTARRTFILKPVTVQMQRTAALLDFGQQIRSVHDPPPLRSVK